MKTRNQHAEGQGLSCPRCASDDLNALDGMNFNAGSIEQEMECETCKAVWWDIYTLTGYEPHIGIEGESLVIPDDAPEPSLAEAVAALRELRHEIVYDEEGDLDRTEFAAMLVRADKVLGT